MALPTAIPTPPRIVTGNEPTAAGVGQIQIPHADSLRLHAKKGEIAILAVAIIQTVVGILALVRSSHTLAQNTMLITTVASFVLAAMFWGLYSWSQSQPLPAAIVGLVIYGTTMGLSITFSLKRLAHGMAAKPGVSALGISWVDIMVIMALIRAVYAGVWHRRLLQQAAQGNNAVAPPAPVYGLSR